MERAHGIAQSRLVLELANHVDFSSLGLDAALAAANAYLPEWVERRNRLFAVAPAKPEDAHVALGLSETERRHLFSRQSERWLTKDLCYSFGGSTYALSGPPAGMSLPTALHANVLAHERADGEVFTTVSGVEVGTRLVRAGRSAARAVETSELNGAVGAATSRRAARFLFPGASCRALG